MSTAERPRVETFPPLTPGQHLNQPTFHERYEAMPPETRAELVGGTVYMPSPMRRDHAGTTRLVSGWLIPRMHPRVSWVSYSEVRAEPAFASALVFITPRWRIFRNSLKWVTHPTGCTTAAPARPFSKPRT